MITDIFARRYATTFWYPEAITQMLQPFFMQATHIVFQDLHTALNTPEALYRSAHDRLARELGLPYLFVDGDNFTQKCARYLANPYNLWNNAHGEPDQFTKARFSMLELLFAAIEQRAVEMDRNAANVPLRGKVDWLGRAKESVVDHSRSRVETVKSAVDELNRRLRQPHPGLAYHNGLLQRETDVLTEEQTTGPFWQVVADPKWSVVDHDMKEACDRADRSEQDATIYAMRALESTVNIISGDRGWSTGKERGAANFIDNLQSARSGGFIAGWESEALKALFRDIRNPQSHGGGSNPPQPLNDQQRRWVIESCMSWIKSLVHR
jgi:hypothetical protein